jgi:hypothetical protein
MPTSIDGRLAFVVMVQKRVDEVDGQACCPLENPQGSDEDERLIGVFKNLFDSVDAIPASLIKADHSSAS